MEAKVAVGIDISKDSFDVVLPFAELTRLKNQQQTFESSGIENKLAKKIITSEIAHLKKQVALVGQELTNIPIRFHQHLFERLQTIKGAAMTLILITDGFSRFENSK